MNLRKRNQDEPGGDPFRVSLLTFTLTSEISDTMDTFSAKAAVTWIHIMGFTSGPNALVAEEVDEASSRSAYRLVRELGPTVGNKSLLTIIGWTTRC